MSDVVLVGLFREFICNHMASNVRHSYRKQGEGEQNQCPQLAELGEREQNLANIATENKVELGEKNPF